MFTINEQKILMKKGKVNIPYFCGNCCSCQFYNEKNSCKKKEIINVISRKIVRFLCKNWQLSQNILMCFKQKNNNEFKTINSNVGFIKVNNGNK